MLQAMVLDIASNATLTVYAEVMQFNVTNLKFVTYIMTALSQNLSMKLCKIPISPGFVQNMTFFYFSDSFFTDKSFMENQNSFDLLAKD